MGVLLAMLIPSIKQQFTAQRKKIDTAAETTGLLGIGIEGH